MNLTATWHKESWDKFLSESLPHLLSEACAISGYSVEPKKRGNKASTCDLILNLSGLEGDIEVRYNGIPMLSVEGLFIVEGQPLVVMPEAEDEKLETVSCCGELALEFLKVRIGKVGDGYLQDAEAVKSWLPLGEWLAEFFREKGQLLDSCNSLSRLTHLRRVRSNSLSLEANLRRIRDGSAEDPAPISQIGLSCPVETPEGPNIYRVLTVARGAVIKDGRLVKVAQSSADALGPTTSMIPFIEYSDPARLLMGANMMRQWVPPLNPEPAIVRTGNEPDDPEFWCGFNLLTAFTSMGRATYEDAVVLSRSAVQRMRCDFPIEVGDKLSNRHGTKGVVSAILPDDEMPKLSDGSPVECVYSFIALHTRMNSGQLLEAVYSRIAEAAKTGEVAKALEGFTGIVPPFEAPSRERMSQWLSSCGLPGNGMESMGVPGDAHPPFPTVVGRVYWGRLHHMVRNKLKIFMKPNAFCQVQGAMEYMALRNCGAYHVISEMNGITSVDIPESADLVERLEKGQEPSYAEETGAYRVLAERLRRGGIRISRDAHGLSFSFLRGEGLELAMPIPHPWRRSEKLYHLPECLNDDDYQKLMTSNNRLRKLMQNGAPESLVKSSYDTLIEQIQQYFSTLIGRKETYTRGPRIFSGRSVIIPSRNLTVNQVGLPEEVIWTLFGPLVAQRAGKKAAAQRTDEADRVLNSLLAERMVFLNRAPTNQETAMLAFHPVRVPHKAIEFHPLVCRWMNADFDGDQMAFFLPVTDEAQADLRERLSVSGHLERDSSLLDGLLPTQEALWGLAWLSRKKPERKKLSKIFGFLPVMPDGILTAASLSAAMHSVLESSGAGEAVAVAEKLMNLGLDAVRSCGASMNPFMKILGGTSGSQIPREEAGEILASSQDYENLEIGPQLLAAKTGARGSLENLLRLLHSSGDVVPTLAGEKRQITAARISGLLPEDFFPLCFTMRKWIAELIRKVYEIGDQRDSVYMPSGYTVLARAARSEEPGIVFASAAARGEVDPLQDIDARLFMGLPVE